MKSNLIFLFCAATYALIPLKLFGVIDWSWWIVLSPAAVITVILIIIVLYLKGIYAR